MDTIQQSLSQPSPVVRPSVPNVQVIQTSAGIITAQYLEDMFTQSSQAEGTRLQVFEASCLCSTDEQVSEAVRSWTGQYTPPKELRETVKSGRATPDQERQFRQHMARLGTIRNRGSEIIAFKTALDKGIFHIDSSKGYQWNITQCRSNLAAAGLNGRGKPLSDGEARAAKRRNREKTEKLLELAGGDISKMKGVSGEQVEEAILRDHAKNFAESLCKKEGSIFCEYLAEALLDLLQRKAQETPKVEEATG